MSDKSDRGGPSDEQILRALQRLKTEGVDLVNLPDLTVEEEAVFAGRDARRSLAESFMKQISHWDSAIAGVMRDIDGILACREFMAARQIALQEFIERWLPPKAES